jgi:hypothetical protein
MDSGESRADPPELTRAAQEIGSAGMQAGRSAWGIVTSFRRLVAADLALSRSAFGLTLAYTAGAIVLGASAWMFLMAAVVLGLQELGLPLVWAVLIPGLASGIGAGVVAFAGSRIFEHTRLDATRRQLARFGWAGDPEHDDRVETGTSPKAEDRAEEPPP